MPFRFSMPGPFSSSPHLTNILLTWWASPMGLLPTLSSPACWLSVTVPAPSYTVARAPSQSCLSILKTGSEVVSPSPSSSSQSPFPFKSFPSNVTKHLPKQRSDQIFLALRLPLLSPQNWLVTASRLVLRFFLLWSLKFAFLSILCFLGLQRDFWIDIFICFGDFLVFRSSNTSSGLFFLLLEF